MEAQDIPESRQNISIFRDFEGWKPANTSEDDAMSVTDSQGSHHLMGYSSVN